MIQQTATSIAKQNTKRDKSRLSTQTRALMKKRREMVMNTARDCIEYTEICKTLKKKVKEDIRKHNLDTIRKTIETSKSLNKVRRTHILGQNRLITLLDNQGREIQDQDKILERIEEFYTVLYDSDQTVTIRTDPRRDFPINCKQHIRLVCLNIGNVCLQTLHAGMLENQCFTITSSVSRKHVHRVYGLQHCPSCRKHLQFVEL